MSTSPQTNVTVDEVIALNISPGSGDTQSNQVLSSSGQGAASCCDDRNHRKLAICSIICGISCIGIKALTNSVKAEMARNPQEAAAFSKRAKKLGTMSIAIWVSILVLIPTLMALFSYIITLQR